MVYNLLNRIEPLLVTITRPGTYISYLQAASTNNNEKNAQEDGPAATGNLLRTLTGPEFSIALGVSILLAVLTNRLATPELIDSQARTDILGVMASGGLITNGVYLLVSSSERFSSFCVYSLCVVLRTQSMLPMRR